MAGKTKASLKKEINKLKAENKGLREQIEAFGGPISAAGDDVEVDARIQALQKENGELKFQLTEAGVATLEANLRERIRGLEVRIKNANTKLKEHGVIVDEEPELEDEPQANTAMNIDVDELGKVIPVEKGSPEKTDIKCPDCEELLVKYSDELYLCPNCDWMGKPEGGPPIIGTVGQRTAVDSESSSKKRYPSAMDIEAPMFECMDKVGCGWRGTDPRAGNWCPECPRKVNSVE